MTGSASPLAVADIDCDEYTDLVVGTPYEDVGGQADSGYVQIIWGGAAGLGTGGPSADTRQTDFGSDRRRRRPVRLRRGCAGGRRPGRHPGAGRVRAGHRGARAATSAATTTPAGSACWHAFDGGNVADAVTQDTPGIPGAAEAGDRFGAAVSLNYLLGPDPALVDVAVGVPNEDIGSTADAGAVTVVQDIYDSSRRQSRLDQN